MTQPGVFDAALVDTTAVLHLASPLANETDNYSRDIIAPAININTSLLTSALHIPTLKRIVITSSMVTLLPFSLLANPPSKIYTSRDINTETGGPYTSAMEAYWSSKALARLAVRAFVATHTPSFEVVQLLPSVVLGADARATSLKDLREKTPLWELKMSPLLGITQNMAMVGVPVDVADVARAHVDAMSPSVLGGEYVLSAETPDGISWDDMIPIVKEAWLERVGKAELPLGGSLPTTTWRIDVGETERAFGWGFRSFEDTVKEAVGQYLAFFDREGEGGAFPDTFHH